MDSISSSAAEDDNCSNPLQTQFLKALRQARRLLADPPKSKSELETSLAVLEEKLSEFRARAAAGRASPEESQVIEGEVLDLYVEHYVVMRNRLGRRLDDEILSAMDLSHVRRLLKTLAEIKESGQPMRIVGRPLEALLFEWGIKKKWDSLNFDGPVEDVHAEQWFVQFYSSYLKNAPRYRMENRLQSEALNFFSGTQPISRLLRELDDEIAGRVAEGIREHYKTGNYWEATEFARSASYLWDEFLAFEPGAFPADFSGILEHGRDTEYRSAFLIYLGLQKFQVFQNEAGPRLTRALKDGLKLPISNPLARDEAGATAAFTDLSWIWRLEDRDEASRKMLSQHQDIFVPAIRYVLTMKHLILKLALPTQFEIIGTDFRMRPENLHGVLADTTKFPLRLVQTLRSIAPVGPAQPSFLSLLATP
jgi:hypothetical protein